MIRAAAALIAVVLLVPQARAAADGPNLMVIEPYGAGSATDRVLAVYKPGLEKATGHPLAIEHDGATSLEKLAAAPPNGHTVMIVDLLSVEIAEAAGQGAGKISALTPVAKLTGPGSIALVVPASSPIKSWADFAAAAKAGTLTIASPGRMSVAGVPLALMEKALGVHFNSLSAATHDDVLAAIRTKKADAAFLATVTLVPGAGVEVPPVRPLVTFGAQRNPRLGPVPTFQEQIGKPHNSITTAIAAFGPSGLDAVAVKRLTTDFIDAGHAAKSAPGAGRLLIDVGDAALLRQTMERDARVIKEVEDLLH